MIEYVRAVLPHHGPRTRSVYIPDGMGDFAMELINAGFDVYRGLRSPVGQFSVMGIPRYEDILSVARKAYEFGSYHTALLVPLHWLSEPEGQQWKNQHALRALAVMADGGGLGWVVWSQDPESAKGSSFIPLGDA